MPFSIGFSLFERAWALRGMEDLFIDMMEAPEFVEELLDAICDYILAPAHGIPGDARPENILALIETVNDQS